MSGRTGLGLPETAVLEAVARAASGRGSASVRCDRVLDALDARLGISPRDGYPVVVDLAVPWRCHLPLLVPVGNVGSQGDDPPADAEHTEVRLSEVGRLALAAERGEVGPVPLGLVEGSFYRDGPVPPFAPQAVVSALLGATGDAGPPVLPTGGIVEGDLPALLAGRTARLRLSCRVEHEPAAPATGGRALLVITEVPLGTSPDVVVQMIAARVGSDVRGPGEGGGHRYADHLPDGGQADLRPHVHPFAADVRDESAGGRTRIVVALTRRADPVSATAWLRDIRPVTVDVEWQLPAPQVERLRAWDHGDGSGLAALADLLDRRSAGRG